MNLFNLKQEAEPEAITAQPTESPTDSPVVDAQPESAWPDKWREMYAGEDDKKLAYLSRYTDPKAALDGGYAAKLKISSGEYKSTSAYPGDGTEDEQSAWRESNGIPTNSEGYDFGETKEDDKGFVEAFQSFAFENNINSNDAGKLVEFLKSQEGQLDEEDKDADLKSTQAAEDQLRIDWQGDYRRNLNAMHGLFDTAPEGVKDAIFAGRLSDGSAFGSNPEVMKFLAGIALQINPLSTVVNTAGGNIASTIDDELETINTMMKEDSKKYYADEKIQERWRELTDAKSNMAG